MPSFSDVQYVFLDRDGVINRKAPEGQYIARWNDMVMLPGVEKAIGKLNHSGKRVIVVSNQRGVALGRYTSADVERLQVQLQGHLAHNGAHVDAFYFCPHDTEGCDCRKPRTGLFEQAFRDFPEASGANSVMIGDSLSDIESGRAAGMRTIFIEGDPEIRKEGSRLAANLADAAADSLAEAVQRYLPVRSG
jgi:D-glycero-D-manno-heptose 1,7-bisphosphate phosphatase